MVLKTLTKTLTFADANTEGSTIALRERCSGKLKMAKSLDSKKIGHGHKMMLQCSESLLGRKCIQN